MVVRRAVFIQSLIVVVYVLFNKQAVCTSAISCNSTNPCEKKELIQLPSGKQTCLTTRLCMKNKCGDCYTKHEKNLDKACQYQKKCCAFNFTKCAIPTGPSIWQ
ncbi:hypothetical protein ABFA07_023285 [Porites harrisoni]